MGPSEPGWEGDRWLLEGQLALTLLIPGFQEDTACSAQYSAERQDWEKVQDTR